tara:strand:- start:1073 stop:1441 length:369 start_codon:yes stop_codon:yes gene_type:complete
MADFSDLIGSVILKVTNHDDEILFETDCGTWVMNHQQDCCESVSIEDITGDLQGLVGGEVIVADERISDGDTTYGSETWTFYTIRTTRGDVDIRWYGSSNGYYSERVDFYKQGPSRCKRESI